MENGWIFRKVTTIGDTPIFHWTMIMEGRVSFIFTPENKEMIQFGDHESMEKNSPPSGHYESSGFHAGSTKKIRQ